MWYVFLFWSFIPRKYQKLELINKKLCDKKNSKNEWERILVLTFWCKENSATLSTEFIKLFDWITHGTISRWYNQQLVIFEQLDNSTNVNVKHCASVGESVIGCTTSILFIVSRFLDLVWIRCVVYCIYKIFSDAFDIRCKMMECSFVGGWHRCLCDPNCMWLCICNLLFVASLLSYIQFIHDELLICIVAFKPHSDAALSHFCTYYI